MEKAVYLSALVLLAGLGSSKVQDKKEEYIVVNTEGDENDKSIYTSMSKLADFFLEEVIF